MALVDNAGSGPAFCSLNIISLRSGDQVKSIKFHHPVTDILCNSRVVVATFMERIAVFNACTFEDRFTISTCYPSPGVISNPIALGTRWLAFQDTKLVVAHQSGGGVSSEAVQSVAASVISAAKAVTKGIKDLTARF